MNVTASRPLRPYRPADSLRRSPGAVLRLMLSATVALAASNAPPASATTVTYSFTAGGPGSYVTDLSTVWDWNKGVYAP